MRNATRPVSILFAHSGLDWITGSERCLLDLVQHLDRDRFRPVVVCNSETLAGAAERLGARVHVAPRYGSDRGRLLPEVSLVNEGRRLLAAEDIRLIHANDFQPVKWLMPAARLAGIPIVLHVHLPTTEEERCYTWSHQVAHVVGVSRSALEGFLDDGLPVSRATVIFNAVDPERLSPGDSTALRSEIGLVPEDAVVLTAVGSLIPRKGFDVLLRAVAQLRAAGPAEFAGRVRLLLVGDGPHREELERLAASLGLTDVVGFLGRRGDVGAILRDATDIALSAAHHEALPLNVLEAGYFGLPLVVSDIPPHRELVEDGRTGLLVADDQPARFADAIGRLIRDVAMRKRLGDAARQHVHANFLIDRYVREFSELYEGLLAARAGTYGPLGGWVWPEAYTRWVRRAASRRLSRFGTALRQTRQGPRAATPAGPTRS